jgi:transcriptional regulator NrdR family protein
MIKCPNCGREFYVKDTRVSDNSVRRRRECSCGFKGTTYEIAKSDYRALLVKMKRYDRLMDYLREDSNGKYKVSPIPDEETEDD